MSRADKAYDKLVQEILSNGVWDKDQKVRTRWKDGTPAHTKSIVFAQMTFDNTEPVILTKKKVAWKTAIKDLPILFWQKKTNKISDLHAMNVHIWDEWEIQEGSHQGTIGKSYGYQLGKQIRKVRYEEVEPFIESGFLSKNYRVDQEDSDFIYIDQVDYLLWQLKTNPASRRHIVSLWNIDDLDEMALNPCVWTTQWIVLKAELHLIVTIRSSDVALGLPFNIFQYQVLQRMIAQVTGYEVGTLTFNISNPHIYERHVEGIKKHLSQEDYPAPILWINPEVKSFYDFTMDDFKLVGYQHGPNISYEVAI